MASLIDAQHPGPKLLAIMNISSAADPAPAPCNPEGLGGRETVSIRNDLSGLPPPDGIVLVDAHPGNSINLLRSPSNQTCGNF